MIASGMTTDPYRPPEANLDVPRPPPEPAPRTVMNAVWLMVASAVLSIVFAAAMSMGAIPKNPGSS